jgi:hypothetical protein
MSEETPVKLYFDYKSPFAFLAMSPAFDLPDRFRISVRWIPYLLRIKGRGSEASTQTGRPGIRTSTLAGGPTGEVGSRSRDRRRSTIRPLR